jgi:hypothetical protein
MALKIRPKKAAFIGQRDELSGTPNGPILVLASVITALLVCGVALLALPGDPAAAVDGLKKAMQDSRVLAPLAIILTIAGAICVRTWSYRRLIRLPGPIMVLALDDAGLPDGRADLPDVLSMRQRLDSHFRQRLSDARLSAPTPTPGSKPSIDLVELLETSNVDAKQPLAALGRLMRIVRPTHAYEVKATLVHRSQSPSHGVVAEVIVLPKRATTLQTYWRGTWEDALDRAATGIAVQVVPRSRHSDRGVWSSWKGLALDETLFETYQRAQRLREARRYEESLALLFDAVRRDPGNGDLRFAIGSLQERLALYLDALVTYRAILEMQEGRVVGRPARRAADRIELFARFRHTVLLGYGEALAEQWLPAPADAAPSRRSDELRSLRAQLRPILSQHFADAHVDAADLRRLGISTDVSEGVGVLLNERPHVEATRDQGPALTVQERARLRQENRRLRERRVHLFFQLLAEDWVARLLKQYNRRTIARLDTEYTWTSHALLSSWAALRTERARHLLRAEQRRQELGRRNRGLPSRTARKNRPPLTPDRWPPSARDVQEMWATSSHGGRSLATHLAASTEFLDHYNAACIYAIGLLPGHEREGENASERKAANDRIESLAEAAVGHLKRAADVGGSSAVAARWDGILADDPDLAGLRGTPAFRRFESEMLPSARPVPVRPSSIVRLNASRNSVELSVRAISRTSGGPEGLVKERPRSTRRCDGAATTKLRGPEPPNLQVTTVIGRRG